MDTLGSGLEALHRKRASDAVWAAADAAHLVLGAFRTAVREGTLEVAPGENPHYLFNPDTVELPAEATFAVADWVREEAFVLGVMQRSTGLEVSWKAGNRIELRVPLPKEAKEAVPEPACAPAPACASVPACASAPVCASASHGCPSKVDAVDSGLVGSSQAPIPSPADLLKMLTAASQAGASPAPSWDAVRVNGSLSFSAAHQTGAPPPKQSLFDRMFGTV